MFPNPSLVLKAPDEIETWETPTVELWEAWLFAELDAGAALGRWWEAPFSEQANAFAVYTAALDREAVAARALEARLRGRGSALSAAA